MCVLCRNRAKRRKPAEPSTEHELRQPSPFATRGYNKSVKPGTWNYVLLKAAEAFTRCDPEVTFGTNDLVETIAQSDALRALTIGKKMTCVSTYTPKVLKKRSNSNMNRLIYDYKIVERIRGGVYQWVVRV